MSVIVDQFETRPCACVVINTALPLPTVVGHITLAITVEHLLTHTPRWTRTPEAMGYERWLLVQNDKLVPPTRKCRSVWVIKPENLNIVAQ